MSATDDETRARWAADFGERARAWWTAEREAELTGGKRLAVLPREAPTLLRALGLLRRDGSLPPAEMRKYLQINHMVRVVEPAMEALGARHEVVRVFDAGCGRSYLTLLLAWVARARWGRRLEVLGVDRNPEIIATCRRIAALAELDDVVRFEAGRLEDYGEVGAHAVIALHACDTATDDAIVLGVRAEAELIAVAPCCQAELARAWASADQDDAFAPIRRSGHFRREVAAHVTDAMRVLLLRAAGYEVTPMEFVAAEHTQKNTLLRAVRGPPNPAARAEYDALVAATGGRGIGLADRL